MRLHNNRAKTKLRLCRMAKVRLYQGNRAADENAAATRRFICQVLKICPALRLRILIINRAQTGLPNNGGRPSTSNEASDGKRIARLPQGDSPKPSVPGTARPASSPLPRSEEEASDNNAAPQNSAPRKIARRTNGDEADLFPTPTPAPRPTPKPLPLPEPKREALTRGRPLSAPKPDYPADAKAKKQEGVVKVRVTLDEQANVTDVEVVSSSGVTALDDASVRAARRRKYQTDKRGDTPVATSLTVIYRWNLKD